MDTMPHIVVGITGCMASYKACELVRGFQKAHCTVEVMMTKSATQFVNPQTFRALTGKDVLLEVFNENAYTIPHISLAKNADLMLIAPCTANTLAKITHGIADNVLTSATLATTAPLAIAPSMNVHMFENTATQENLQTLRKRGVHIIEPESGYLACGEIGQGRLANTEDIVAASLAIINKKHDLKGKRILVTAGPTQEAIDPVRYITNHSSGKMGFACAEAAANRGAEVTLVSGPVSLATPASVKRIDVVSAQDMYNACLENTNYDLAIFAAAVGDMRPEYIAEQKLKKQQDNLDTLNLVENPDIIENFAQNSSACIVGFAAETQNLIEHAQEKLQKKHADIIVANNVNDGVFGSNTNKVSFISKQGTENLERMSKSDLADIIIDKAFKLA